MKLISFGNLNKKFFSYLIAFIIIEVILNLIVLYINNNADNQICIPLEIIIKYCFRILFIIPEILIKKKNQKEKNGNQKNKIIDNKIVYIYKHPSKNIKTLMKIIILVFLYFIYNSSVVFFKISYEEQYKLLNAEGVASLEIFYSLLIYRIIYKTSFYRH